MTSDKETVMEAIVAVRKMIHECPAINGGTGEFEYQLKANGAIDRILAAHERDHEAARRRAERSAIYNMLESFPPDWECNQDAVRKWMTAWYKNADDLCEGGPYAEQ